MKKSVRFSAIVSFVLVGTLGVACSPGVDAPGGLPVIQADTGSRVKTYMSLEELADDAAAVVIVGGAESVEQRKIAGANFEVTVSPVKQVIAGSDLRESDLITLHSLPRGRDDGRLVLESEGTYLVFVTPFYTTIGEMTGEWVATGASAGIYVQLSDGLFHRLDPESTFLPETIDIESLRLPELHPASYFISTGADLR